MIKFTEQEYFQITGENLNERLPKDIDGKQTKRFIDFNCREIDDYIREVSPRLFQRGYENLSEVQKARIKEAAITHSLERFNTGTVFYDENGLPKEIPISQRVKRLLSPILYRGV